MQRYANKAARVVQDLHCSCYFVWFWRKSCYNDAAKVVQNLCKSCRTFLLFCSILAQSGQILARFLCKSFISFYLILSYLFYCKRANRFTDEHTFRRVIIESWQWRGGVVVSKRVSWHPRKFRADSPWCKTTTCEMKRVRRWHCVNWTDDTVLVAGVSRHSAVSEMYVVRLQTLSEATQHRHRFGGWLCIRSCLSVYV